jgi:Flp pilus assembly protein TadG
MSRLASRSTRLRARLARYLQHRGGNVAIITAFMIIPIIFSMGMGIDYTLAARRQDQINGIADTAALSAVTPAMMSQTSTVAASKAQSVFLSQIAGVPDINFSAANLSVQAVDTAPATGLTRTVTVNYNASSQTLFSGVIGMNTLPVVGKSVAVSSLAPRIDFYILLDTSPSMEIAATTAGITTMVNATASQGGCAFGCHEADPAADNLGNPGGEDNYALARHLGVTLRIDLVNQAVQNLMTVAPTTAAANNTSYRAGIFTMDYAFNTLSALTSNFAAAQAAAANIQAVEVYDNNCLTKSICNSDEDSYLDSGLGSINALMPLPGNGTANVGDSPQEVLFIVSDGLNDEVVGGGRTYPPISTNTNWCTTIKNRGIRIAFLYTTYNPLPTNSWYNSYVAPVQPNIATAAQNCASPGLFYQVNTDGDISAALAALFRTAVATAHLTQ